MFGLFGVVLSGFILMFSIRVSQWGLERNGVSMTILAIGACMIMIGAAQPEWTAPRVLRPLLEFGERSYEIYLTHMFVVFACFEVFLQAGKPMQSVPLLFAATLMISALIGDLTARWFSEPMNRRLRKLFGQESNQMLAVRPAVPSAPGPRPWDQLAAGSDQGRDN